MTAEGMRILSVGALALHSCGGVLALRDAAFVGRPGRPDPAFALNRPRIARTRGVTFAVDAGRTPFHSSLRPRGKAEAGSNPEGVCSGACRPWIASSADASSQ